MQELENYDPVGGLHKSTQFKKPFGSGANEIGNSSLVQYLSIT
jgi:hypothetical protein